MKKLIAIFFVFSSVSGFSQLPPPEFIIVNSRNDTVLKLILKPDFTYRKVIDNGEINMDSLIKYGSNIIWAKREKYIINKNQTWRKEIVF